MFRQRLFCRMRRLSDYDRFWALADRQLPRSGAAGPVTGVSMSTIAPERREMGGLPTGGSQIASGISCRPKKFEFW